MTKRLSNQAGFGAVEAVLVAVIVILIGALGYVGYKAFNKPAATDSTTTTKPVAKTTQPADPYTGWKTNCSTTGALCFKYPSDWKSVETAADDPANSSVTVTSPSNQTYISYIPVVDGLGGVALPNTNFFNTISIDKPTSPQAGNLKVVKGINTRTEDTSPINSYYYVSSDDQIAKYGLAVGKNVDVGFFVSTLTNPTSGSHGIEFLTVGDYQGKSFKTVAEATAWFTTPEVITAGKILSSVTLN
ncbi:MAG: hypothetical protein ABI716_02915 [Candidatus Saccharibacteria bacterium]